MDDQRRCLRAGAAVLGLAVALRLLSSGTLLAALTKPETVAVLMYLETGRVVHPINTLTYPAESPIPEPTESALSPPTPVFTAGDIEKIQVDNDTDYDPDISALLQTPLDWDLTGGKPRVLILHTHASESYTPSPGEIYEEASDYRTLDSGYNMLSIGDAVAKRLEAAGIGVIHDKTLHDYPSYDGSYTAARETLERVLAENPDICLVLDLHRDAVDAPDGGQLDTSATVAGKEAAQLMLVVGTDAGGLYHPNWQENFSLALKLHAQLERENPGICRPTNLCLERFNTDESPGALLVEVGGAGNTRQEALLAAGALADGIIALARGANLTADSTSATPAPGPLPGFAAAAADSGPEIP